MTQANHVYDAPKGIKENKEIQSSITSVVNKNQSYTCLPYEERFMRFTLKSAKK